MMRRTLLLVTLLACSKSKDSPKAEPPPAATATAAKAAEPAAAPPPKLPGVAGLFTCKAKDPAAQMAKAPASKDPYALPFTFAGCPAIPPVFAKADFGMEESATTKAVPGSKVEDHIGYLYLGRHPFRQQFAMHFSDAGKLEAFAFKVDEPQFADLKAAWGEPVAYENIGDKRLAWYNPAAKIKVTASPDKLDRTSPKTREDEEVPGYSVHVERYMPLAELLSKDGLLGAAILGKTPQELATAFPDYIDIKSKEQNHADLAKVGVDKETMKKVDALGAAGDTVSLDYPETETQDHQTLVQTDLAGGKVASYTVILPYGKDAKLRDEIIGQIAASLGAPVGSKQDLGDWTYTFKGPQNLVVDVSPGILKEDWHVRVHAP